MSVNNLKKIEVTPSLEFFFSVLEREDQQRREQQRLLEPSEALDIEMVESFVRTLKTQNIFIHTVGLSGKHESTILSKAIFSLNKVIKIYYSTSFDENDTGFLRIRSDELEHRLVIERLHGYRPVAERLYSSTDQCHIIRYITKWLVNRVDWQKTKLSTLDIYDAFLEKRQQDLQDALYEEQTWMENAEMH